MATHGAMTLGTQLRHLAELLDGAVESVYVAQGLDYRPRYTPVMRVLIDLEAASIRTISQRAGVTHSAVSQTVAQMGKAGLVEVGVGSDARERVVALTPAAIAMLPQLQRRWTATHAAARELERELSSPLGEMLAEAIAALEHHPFAARIERASAPSTRTARKKHA